RGRRGAEEAGLHVVLVVLVQLGKADGRRALQGGGHEKAGEGEWAEQRHGHDVDTGWGQRKGAWPHGQAPGDLLPARAQRSPASSCNSCQKRRRISPALMISSEGLPSLSKCLAKRPSVRAQWAKSNFSP